MAHDVQIECTFCGGVNHSAEQCFKRIIKEKEIYRTIATTNGKIMVRLKTEIEHLCKRGDKEMDSLWNNSSV